MGDSSRKRYPWEFWAIPKIALHDPYLTLEEKVVVGIFVTRMNGQNLAWPKLTEIAFELSCSLRSVQRYIKHLEVHGWIIPIRDAGGRICEYTVNIPGENDRDKLSRCHRRHPRVSPSYMYKEQFKEHNNLLLRSKNALVKKMSIIRR